MKDASKQGSDQQGLAGGGSSVTYINVQSGNEFSLSDMLEIVARGRRFIAASLIVCIAIAVAVAFLMTPVYRSEALVEVVMDKDSRGALSSLQNQFGGLASLTGIDLQQNDSRDVALAALRSRAFLEEFISEQKLLHQLFADEWDSEANSWKASAFGDPPSLWDAHKRFTEDVLSIDEDARTGLVTIGMEWHDREKAALWVSALIAKANKRLRDSAVDEATRSIDYLRAELERTSVSESRRAISTLMMQSMNKLMLADIKDEYAFRTLDPAAVSPVDKFEQPKRLLIIFMGGLAGLMLGLLASLFSHALTKRESEQ